MNREPKQNNTVQKSTLVREDNVYRKTEGRRVIGDGWWQRRLELAVVLRSADAGSGLGSLSSELGCCPPELELLVHCKTNKKLKGEKGEGVWYELLVASVLFQLGASRKMENKWGRLGVWSRTLNSKARWLSSCA